MLQEAEADGIGHRMARASIQAEDEATAQHRALVGIAHHMHHLAIERITAVIEPRRLAEADASVDGG
ncbi:hypothetical protein D3C87_1899640 [compost metagenome]